MSRLKDIKNIAGILKYKYAKILHEMTFVFCYKRSDNRYFIFQELSSVPIQRFVYHGSNDSISFSAGWSAWGNPYSLVTDGRNEQTEVWQDMFDRSTLRNAYLNLYGNYNDNQWNAVNRKNIAEKRKRLKTKFDTVFEFRTDKIRRASFYPRWFEIYSETLSFIALSRYSLGFPYQIDSESSDSIEGSEPEAVSNITHNGKTFDFSLKVVGEVPDDYWDFNDNDPENDAFDEYLTRSLYEDNKDIKGSCNVGQRNVNLLL